MKKFSFQKLFCALSILFIVSCTIFYGTRFLKFYLEENKIFNKKSNYLADKINDNNDDNENFKNINGSYYFIGNSTNNYLRYSNILWRIIKINDNDELVLISDSSVTSLANIKYINTWLNSSEDEFSGIFENVLNKKEEILSKTVACNDVIDSINNTPCVDTNQDNYVSLLSTIDYANIGKDSYLNNGEYFYLANSNNKNNVWYISDTGKVMTGSGNDILGIRPVITVKNLDYVDGDGSKDNPYIVEKEFGLFGSYVKLDNDLWQIYQVNDNDVRLVLNDYLKVNDKEITHKYSNISSYHNDTKVSSLAYYLNNTYLNSLSYKDKIKEVKWSNGYYNNSNDFDYSSSLVSTIDSKVALVSVGDIILNNDKDSYYTMTGNTNNGSMVYVINKNKKLSSKYITNELYVVPSISLDKNLLVKGNGSFDEPFEME